jgi:hypothetical protein
MCPHHMQAWGGGGRSSVGGLGVGVGGEGGGEACAVLLSSCTRVGLAGLPRTPPTPYTRHPPFKGGPGPMHTHTDNRANERILHASHCPAYTHRPGPSTLQVFLASNLQLPRSNGDQISLKSSSPALISVITRKGRNCAECSYSAFDVHTGDA